MAADFSQVTMEQDGAGVRVRGARGRAPGDCYKVSATYMDGYKVRRRPSYCQECYVSHQISSFQATCVVSIAGGKAAKKARLMADSILSRSRNVFQKLKLSDFDKTHVQVLGAEDSFGANAMSSDLLPR